MPFDTARSLAKNAAFLTAARLLPRLLQMLYMVILARFLGPELYGLFAYGQSWYLAILPITSFGLHLVLAKGMSRSQDEASNTLAHTLTLRTGVAASATLLSMGAAQRLEPDHAGRMLLLVFSCAILGRAVVAWTEHAFVAFEAARYALRCELYFRPLESILGIIVLLAGGKALAVALLHALIWYLHASTALIIIHRRLTVVRFGCTWQTVRAFLGFGWPLSLNVFCTGFLLQGPVVLYRYVAHSDPHIGQIAMPLQAMAILCILPAALSSSSLPVLARSVHRADGQDLRIAQAIMRLSYGFGAMAGLIGLTMGPWLVNTFLGTHYALAGTLVGPTLWLVIPYACGQALASLCLVRGRTFAVLACSAGGVLVLVAAIPLLTIWLGSYGAIAATAVALLSWTLLLMILCAAIDAGQVTACFVRSTVWVSGALAVYALLHPLSAFLALGVSLLVLWFSAPVIGIVQSHELKAVRQLLGL